MRWGLWRSRTRPKRLGKPLASRCRCRVLASPAEQRLLQVTSARKSAALTLERAHECQSRYGPAGRSFAGCPSRGGATQDRLCRRYEVVALRAVTVCQLDEEPCAARCWACSA